jgi:hypothetical protein
VKKHTYYDIGHKFEDKQFKLAVNPGRPILPVDEAVKAHPLLVEFYGDSEYLHMASNPEDPDVDLNFAHRETSQSRIEPPRITLSDLDKGQILPHGPTMSKTEHDVMRALSTLIVEEDTPVSPTDASGKSTSPTTSRNSSRVTRAFLHTVDKVKRVLHRDKAPSVENPFGPMGLHHPWHDTNDLTYDDFLIPKAPLPSKTSTLTTSTLNGSHTYAETLNDPITQENIDETARPQVRLFPPCEKYQTR